MKPKSLVGNDGKGLLWTFFLMLIVVIFAFAGGLKGQTNVGSGIILNVPPPPQMPVGQISGTVVGTKGTQVYYYWVVTRYIGGNSLASGPVKVIGVPDELDGDNYVVVSFVGMKGAIGYDVLRWIGPNFPNTPANIAVVSNTQSTFVNDQSNSLNSYNLVSAGAISGSILLNNIDYITPTIVFNPEVVVSGLDLTVNSITAATGNVTNIVSTTGTIQNIVGNIINATVGTFSSMLTAESISLGQTGTTQGKLNLTNPTTGDSFTLEAWNTTTFGGGDIKIMAPINSPFVTSVSSASFSNKNYSPLICNSTVEADGFNSCFFGNGYVPFPTGKVNFTPTVLNDANYHLVSCNVFNADHFAGTETTGRSLRFINGGDITTSATDVPTLAFKITLYTTIDCTSGGTDIMIFPAFTATSGVVTNGPWNVTADIFAMDTTSVRSTGYSVFTTAPFIRLSTSGVLSFLFANCSAGAVRECGIGLSAIATTGGSATVSIQQWVNKVVIE